MIKWNNLKISIMLLGIFPILSFLAFAQEKNKITENSKNIDSDVTQSAIVKKKEINKNIPRMIVYKPPSRGKPSNRVAGGTRGIDTELPVITALVPEHTGLTTQSQPNLYWYLSQLTNYKIEFTLNSEKDIKPILEISLNSINKKGIQVIRLSQYNINLISGIEYRWVVALIPDPEHRSKDIIVTGTIKHVSPSKELANELSEADKKALPYIYAEHGIWYDALSSISDLINENPNDRNLIEQRLFLLQQVDLSGITDN